MYINFVLDILNPLSLITTEMPLKFGINLQLIEIKLRIKFEEILFIEHAPWS